MSTQNTINSRLAGNESELAELQAAHVRATYDLEDAIAFRPHERDAARKHVASIAEKIELAKSMRTGLSRRVVLEDLAAFDPLVEEADAVRTASHDAYEQLSAYIGDLEAKLKVAYEREPALRIARDQGHSNAYGMFGVRARRDQFALDHAAEIAEALALVQGDVKHV